MLRCAELHLIDDMLATMSMGMVYDMLIEKTNDKEEYPFLAMQEDIDAFFPK